MSYKSFHFDVTDGVAHLVFSQPEKRHAMGADFWSEMPKIFDQINQDHTIRVVVMTAEGPHFSSGIDLTAFAKLTMTSAACAGRQREALRRLILDLQAAFVAIDTCRVPVLCGIQGACIGGGVDMITAVDMRYATRDAYFVIKEIDIGMTADVGTLQRLPKLIPDGVVRELAYTGRKMSADEALKLGLLNHVYDTAEEMQQVVMDLAKTIAAKSPLSIEGTKEMIRYARDHSVEQGLNYVATWNAGMLMSNDLMEAMQANMQKRAPEFTDTLDDLKLG